MDDLEVKEELLDLEEHNIYTRNGEGVTDVGNMKKIKAQDISNQNNKDYRQDSDKINGQRIDNNNLQEQSNVVNKNGHEKDPSDTDGTRIQNEPIKKRKLKREIDFLDIKVDYDDEFEPFADNNTVYRKYRLRGPRTIQKSESPAPVIKTKNKQRGMKYEDHDAEMYDCSTCKKQFDSKTGLLNHMRIHQTVRKFMCALCFADFKTNTDLIKHKFIHEDEGRTFICKQCRLAFTNHCDFLIHDLTHMVRTHYKCTECGLYFYNKYGFQIHIQTHFDRKTECSVCGIRIKTTSLQGHMSSFHGNVLECVECGKRCNGKTHFNYHMATHTGLKLFQCLYCGKGFLRSGARIVHTRVHTNERPFECQICHQKFKQQTDCKKHTAIHEKTKKYSCEVCNKKFFHQESVASHMSIHNGTEKYRCKICGKAIATKTGVRVHMLYKHSTERLFKCEPCNMKFKDSKSLKRHNQSISHKNNQYASTMKKENPCKDSFCTVNS